ncbi:MAG: hypothetical protein MAG451_00518 [Anaerolineales bacterium]|nr:hypothetical protein [Anaerolineales bacterium]
MQFVANTHGIGRPAALLPFQAQHGLFFVGFRVGQFPGDDAAFVEDNAALVAVQGHRRRLAWPATGCSLDHSKSAVGQGQHSRRCVFRLHPVRQGANVSVH